MRRPIVVGNWKMYTRAADATILATTLRDNLARLPEAEIVLCPPAVWISEVLAVVGRGRIELGAQNMYFEVEGAFTGEISPLMIRDVAKYVIIGHSERREHFGETDEIVNEKTIAALEAGLVPIVCVGERKKKNNPAEPVAELKAALEEIPKKRLTDIVVAYEPVWAIGTGDNAAPEYVARVINQLREVGLAETPVLYGGSVNSKNIAAYAARPEIDGVLVGGASIRSSEFVKICETWARVKHFRSQA
ncbi:MAG: triose-phosphate isomerase [Patescibacteria group bacterium]